MKKLISLLLCLSMILLCSTSVFATTEEENSDGIQSGPTLYLDSTSKTAFAAEKDALYAALPSICTFNSDEEKIEYTSSLKSKASFATGDEYDAIIEELESLGVYLYPTETYGITPRATDSGDISMNAPLVYYNAWESTWSVTCSGSWKNDDWYHDRAVYGNVGGRDAFGVAYYNVSGTYSSSIVRQSAHITNGQSGNAYQSSSTSLTSTGNGASGFGFELQDKVVSFQGNLYYLGKTWSAECTYSSAFSSYSGVATAYYVHTWDDASISSITLNLGEDNLDVSITITSSSDSFTAYSTDKTF